MAQHMNTTRARQGRPGRPILVVLIVSTVLAAAVLFGVWAFKSKDLATAAATPGPAASAGFDTPEPTPRQNEATPPPAR